MALTRAIMLGGIGGIAVPFALAGSGGLLAGLVGTMTIHIAHGAAIPWSWPVFCIITLAAWGLLRAAR